VYTSRGRVEGEDWPAVAAALNQRMAERRIGQQELAQLSGVSVSTLRQVQHGAGRRVQNKTLTAISRALEWPEQHLTGVLVSNRETRTAGASAVDESQVLATLKRIEQAMNELTERVISIEDTIGAQTFLPSSGRELPPTRR
jgi:DNA-binding Xre family transcriptional regulator